MSKRIITATALTILIIGGLFLHTIGFNWSHPIEELELIPLKTAQWWGARNLTYEEVGPTTGPFQTREEAIYSTQIPEQVLEDEAEFQKLFGPDSEYAKTYGWIEALDMAVPPPRNEYTTELPENHTGLIKSYAQTCKINLFSSPHATCTYQNEHQQGTIIYEMRIPTIYDQTATITASVEQGTARIYIPYYNGYEYIDITPTTSGEISGWLEQSPYAAGELGVYGIWVEAVEGEIKGFSMRAES